MDGDDAKRFVESLRHPLDAGGWPGRWKDPRHIATDKWKDIDALVDGLGTVTWDGRDYTYGVAAVELHLTKELPDITDFYGIVNVDRFGIWWCDLDGDVSEPPWRPTLIPWHAVESVRLYQSS